MDIRDIIRAQPDVVVGHTAVMDSLNVRNETKRFTSDPLQKLISAIGDSDSIFTNGDIGRYLQAYSWYKLSLRRTLEQISLARRAHFDLHFYSRNRKYSKRQKLLASKHNEIAPYTELDYQNLIIHTCILLDRVIALSRRFLNGGALPSFTSFNKHRQFLKSKPKSLDSSYSEYTQTISNNTEWFSVPLKVLRDKYLMHSSEKHMAFFGWGESNWDLYMTTVIPAKSNQEKLLEKVKAINFTPRRLARDIEEFLSWYAKYAASKLKR